MSSHDSSNYSKTWELSLYEQNRTPHEVITDDTEIAVSPKSLHNELMCPICLDILKNTMTTKECLHRFCQDCIITALRAGNKECPTCRKKLISKRSLRRDPNFDALISKIYPNREEYDALHEKVLEKLNKKHLTAIQHPSRGSGGGTIERQNSRRTNLNINNNNNNSNNNNNNQNTDESQTNATTSTNTGSATNASTSNATNSNNNNNHRSNHESSSSSRKRVLNSDESDMESRTSTERSHLQNDYDEIELVLKPHPKELHHNSKRFLKTTSNATIGHLSKYLTTRLCVETNTTSNGNNSLNNNNNNSNTAASTSATACTTSTTITNQKSTLSNDATMDFNFNLYVSSSSNNNTENKQTTNNLTSPQQQQQSHQLLAPNSTLDQIIDKYWKLNKPLELYYLYKGTNNTNNNNNNSNLVTNTNSTTS